MSLMHKIYQQATLTLEVLSSRKYTIINKITMGNIQGFKTDSHRKERINLKKKKNIQINDSADFHKTISNNRYNKNSAPMMMKTQVPSTKIQPKESANDDENPNTIINQAPMKTLILSTKKEQRERANDDGNPSKVNQK